NLSEIKGLRFSAIRNGGNPSMVREKLPVPPFARADLPSADKKVSCVSNRLPVSSTAHAIDLCPRTISPKCVARGNSRFQRSLAAREAIELRSVFESDLALALPPSACKEDLLMMAKL